MLHYGLSRYDQGGTAVSALSIDGINYNIAQIYEQVHHTACPEALFSTDTILQSWQIWRDVIEELAQQAISLAANGKLEGIADAQARLLAPYTPQRIFCAASNYLEHAAEMQTDLQTKAESSPYVFMKADSSVVGPDDAVVMPPETVKLDWEVELGVIIGKGGRRIQCENARSHIAGYTIVNDVSARDLNRRSDYPFKHDWFRGKSWDTFCPIGPRIVPASCIADPHNLGMCLSLNGETMQDGVTAKLIFNIDEQIAYISSLLTLRPGDLIATGTPDGVGAGRGLFLKHCDVMVASIDHIGELRNPIVAENQRTTNR